MGHENQTLTRGSKGKLQEVSYLHTKLLVELVYNKSESKLVPALHGSVKDSFVTVKRT